MQAFMTSTMDGFMTGMNVMACFAVALFFLRFWKRTDDRLFLIFALAFCVLAVSRVVIMNSGKEGTYNVYAYSFRLATYLLILAAIVDKNRSKR